MAADYLPRDLLRRRLARLSRAELLDRLHAARALSAVRGLRYVDDDDTSKTIELALVPWVVTPTQLAFFRDAVHQMVSALAKLPRLYAQDPQVRRILPFDAMQESWLHLAVKHTSAPFAVLGRLDSTAAYGHANWRADFQFLEPNCVGVGGVHYAPAGCSVLVDVLADLCEHAFPGRTVGPTPDPRQLLIEELTRVARRIGRPLRRVALIENTDYTTGTDEFSHLARYLSGHGLKAIVIDPRRLRLSGDRIMADGKEIDVLYRDCELGEFIEMEAGGRSLKAVRKAVQDGRLISGLLWEFDQKSCWELFTEPRFASQFTPRQRQLFQHHVPWTRLVREDRVSDPHGARVDLPAFVRRQKDKLVLKPNTLYGGQGVVVGHAATQRLWEQTLAKALRGRTRYVVQELAKIHTERFAMLSSGGPQEVERRVVSGFFFNSTGIGLVGRFSQQPVVNVSRGGGLLPALMVES